MARPEHDALARAVIEGDVDAARGLAQAWAESGGDPLQAVERGFSDGLRRVGELWEDGEYFLPELIQ